jgi:DNA-binding transcriptional LysR family regulator
MHSLQTTLPGLLVFCAAYELGSFTKAAKQLGVTPQAASRSVTRLEEVLGTRLFRRTTRAIAPTDAARAFYTTSKQGIALLQRAEEEASRGAELSAGVVRISAPTSYGHYRLLPLLGLFRERYPRIELDVDISNRNIDFAKEGFDLAIRMGQIKEEGLVARRLGDFALGVYAAPEYLARKRAPKEPSQLSSHDCIVFLLPRTGRVLPWTFSPGPTSFVPPAKVRCSDDVLATVTLARAGVGLIQTYDFLVHEDVERGKLQEVLRDYRGGKRPFSLVYPQSQKLGAAARTLADFLLSRRETQGS